MTNDRETEIVRERPQVVAFLLPHGCSLPASWPWESGNSRLPERKESTHPLWNICKVLVLPGHNGRGLHTMLRSSAQQREMTHPVRAKRTHHPIVRYHCVAGGVLSGEENWCAPFVFISNCLNPCSFHWEAGPAWACGAVKRAWQLEGKKLTPGL